MRHRIVNGTGLGNSSKILLDNSGILDDKFAKDAFKQYFKKYSGFDYSITEDYVINIGIEPAYMYDRLKIISVNKDKGESFIMVGRAWGPYGSQIASTKKLYKEYKNDCKFTKFIDTWHPILFGK